MSDSREEAEKLNHKSEVLSLELDGLNDDIDRKKRQFSRLQKELRELNSEDHLGELQKLLQEKKELQKKLESLESKVTEKLGIVEELESEGVFDEEQMSKEMEESLNDLDLQVKTIKKKVDDKMKELNTLKQVQSS